MINTASRMKETLFQNTTGLHSMSGARFLLRKALSTGLGRKTGYAQNCLLIAIAGGSSLPPGSGGQMPTQTVRFSTRTG